jgi:putative ABC transport system substrate-binding protein
LNRRDLLMLGSTAIAWPLAVHAQQPGKVHRIGVLSLADRTSIKIFDAFRGGLRDLGYVEGQNITIEYRLAAGDFSRLPAMAGDLVRLPVEIIVIDGGAEVAQIAHDATPTIPIVGPLGPDPVAAGLAASLAHPGGNVTGHSGFGELSGKRLQLLKEALPAISRVASLSEGANPFNVRATEEVARTLGVELRTIDVATPDDIPAGFEAAAADGAEALVILPGPMFLHHRARIIALAAQYAMPAIYAEREYADDGGLLAYGQNISNVFRRMATYVDKVLKGAKPGDLPIEQPTKFELVINLKTAKALGLTVPQSLFARADEVIE